MRAADGGDPRVMNGGSGNLARFKELAEVGPIGWRFSDQAQSGGFEPSFQIGQRDSQWRWRLEDPGVGDYGEEFMHARPRNGPRDIAFRQFLQAIGGGNVPRRVHPVGVDEDVGVQRRHSGAPFAKSGVSVAVPRSA